MQQEKLLWVYRSKSISLIDVNGVVDPRPRTEEFDFPVCISVAKEENGGIVEYILTDRQLPNRIVTNCGNRRPTIIETNGLWVYDLNQPSKEKEEEFKGIKVDYFLSVSSNNKFFFWTVSGKTEVFYTFLNTVFVRRQVKLVRKTLNGELGA